MSEFDANPFADPVDINPFQVCIENAHLGQVPEEAQQSRISISDPSVTQLANANQQGIDDFNPFTENSRLNDVEMPALDWGEHSKKSYNTRLKSNRFVSISLAFGALLLPQVNEETPPISDTKLPAGQKTTPSQPAILPTTVEPSPQATAAAAQLALLRQQEELEKKAAELDRKEQELKNESYTSKRNNWPPFPSFCPIKPCFYQDFAAEIPSGFQRTVKMLYYLWMFHAVTLFLNLLACLAEFIVDSKHGVDFGLAILWFLLFTPCAFLCWYRPVYKAFRSDSSFNFFFFFFVFFCQIVLYIIQAVGIPNWGVSGWIAALSWTKTNLAVAVVMMVVAVFFTVCAVLSLLLVQRVHSIFRSTGASFQRAQEEFSHGVFSNTTVRSAAATAASAAAQSTFQGN